MARKSTPKEPDSKRKRNGGGGRPRREGRYTRVSATLDVKLKEQITKHIDERSLGYGKISGFVEEAIRNELARAKASTDSNSDNGRELSEENLAELTERLNDLRKQEQANTEAGLSQQECDTRSDEMVASLKAWALAQGADEEWIDRIFREADESWKRHKFQKILLDMVIQHVIFLHTLPPFQDHAARVREDLLAAMALLGWDRQAMEDWLEGAIAHNRAGMKEYIEATVAALPRGSVWQRLLSLVRS